MNTDKLFDKSYEYIRQQGYSYDDIAHLYDKIKKSGLTGDICDLDDEYRNTEIFLEALKRYFDEKPYDKDILHEITDYKRDFQYYPDSKEPSFVAQLTQKKEMVVNYVSKKLKTPEEKCNRDFFELAPHQIFLKNLMSKSSPYNGLLIFHGVGVGKTCSAITIAENFKDTYKDKHKRIIILASKNIQIGWMKTIYDPQRGENQCTGDSYNLEDDTESPIQNIEWTQKRKIRNYYELHGYTSFSNSVKRLLQKYMGKDLKKYPESAFVPYIDKHFSNRVLIIDEVHNIRTGSESEIRDRIYYINLVIQYSRDLKLILLTANPMYNMANEIVWILNMLLLNDHRPKIEDPRLFDEEGLTRVGSRIIRNKCQGYVSYIRGENPVSFPVRLYPDHNLRNMISSDNPPTHDIFGKPLSSHEQISFLKIYSSRLRGYQKSLYTQQLSMYHRDDEIHTLQIQDESRLLQLANIAYPSDSSEPSEACGENGLTNCFHITKKQGRIEYRYKDSCPEFLDEDVIGEYSTKLESILKCIRETEGIIFIYTNWIGAGVIPLVLALEQNGYQKYDGSTILKGSRKRHPISYEGTYQSSSTQPFITAKYMVIAGSQENLTHNLRDELKVVTSRENKDGSRIKVIIGSSVAAEGLDFKCIRAIHILEPWHNLNKVEQVIGRGVRNCSHQELPPEKRNVTIYLHGIRDNTHETIDHRLYRYSEKKAMVIGDVETILKQEAIDRHLFKHMNHLTDLDVEPMRIKPAYRTSKAYTYTPKDKPFSRVCSFQPKCEYIRDTLLVKPTTANMDTLSFQYLQGIIDVYIKRISLIVRDIGAFTLSEISQMIDTYQSVDPVFLERALQQMISLKLRIINSLGEPGYLSTIGDMFVFQPSYNPDPTLPYYYRLHRNTTDSNERDIHIAQKRESEISTEDIRYTLPEIMKSLKVVSQFYWNLKETLVKKQYNITHLSQFGYIYDRLHYDHRKALTYLSLIKIDDSEFSEENLVWVQSARDYCARFHVCYDESTDTYLYGTNKHATGFFLYHSKNKRVYGYSLDDKTLSLMNEIENQQMLSDISVSKRLVTYTKESWAFMLFVNRYSHQHCGMVCKVCDTTDKGDSRRKNFTYPPGEGTIIRDTNRNDSRILSLDPVSFILREFPTFMKSFSKTQIEELRRENSRIEYCAMIELFFRERNRCLSQDVVWLRYL